MGHLKGFKEKHLKAPRRPILLGVFSLVVLGGALTWQIARAEGRILPNVSVGGIDIGQMTPEDARTVLADALRALNVAGIEFTHGGDTVRVAANEKSAAPPEQSIVTYDLDGMIEEAYLAGNTRGRTGLIAASIQAIFSDIELPVRVSVNEEVLKELFRQEFGEVENKAKDADIVIEDVRRFDPATSTSAVQTASVRTETRVRIVPEESGMTFDYDGAIRAATAGLANWKGGSYPVEVVEAVPSVTAQKAELMKDAVLDVLEKGGVTLAYDDMTWELKGDAFREALTLKAHPDGSLYVGIRRSSTIPLLAKASASIDQAPRGTHIELNDAGTRAVEFRGGQVGRELDEEASLALLDERVSQQEAVVIPLVVRIAPAKDSSPLAEELGIRELLGWGTSDFSGSPTNRRKNIQNGVDLLNGLVIKPGEEFGLIEHLKPFDASGGYLPELVIKGNRTIREYGGGLCQIGTTTFRAVMGAGLPITQRQNHSFRVRYYEPVGTDATLYDPAPDFKFVNDTGHHAVLVTKMIGDILRFEFWGTRDGRVQERTPVRILAEPPAPAPKLIPTSGLAPGQKVCFENGYAGATTTFDYVITYPNGERKEQTFRSYYKPWQAQCLVGEVGAPNIRLQWDGSLKEFPPEPGADPVEVKVAPDEDQCSVGGCPG